MKTESFIGLRYLWNTRRTRFLSVITVICVLGISIGVAALICVQSIMDGLQNQMKKTILGAKAHISVEHIEGEFRDYENIRTEILKHEEISGVTPIISRDVIFSSNDEMIGAVLNGIDPATAETALLLPSQIISGSLECLEEPSTCSAIIEKRMKDPSKILKRDLENESGKTRYPGIAIGSELAKFYGIDIGDVMKVISPVGGGMGPAGPVPLIRSFQVAAVFYSGLYEYDLNYGYITLKNAADFFSTEDKVDFLGVKLKDVYGVDKPQELIKNVAGDKYTVKNWRDMNRQLFGALKMEKLIWFLILGFIVLVAAFNIVSALVMLVMGKKEEIAILRAVGFTAASVMKIFMLDGVVIGFLGTVLGTAAGYAICVFLDGLTLSVAQDVYYIDRIPVDMSVLTFVYSSAGSMVLSVIATIYPGRKAASMSPSEALRHD
ncbi:MAG TPA: ABC transporter permease [bacterium]|nr:ABC transporter permease [bacterium]MDX9804639.1 ABC transporter permease [bacterium]HNZ53093.1 ABC transporter permease [bacterium]HOB70588.1 ABC transporter permease [bacterium]HPV20247.1 ABC transporter permease [bacterium]